MLDVNIIELLSKYPKAKICQDHRHLEEGDIFVAIKGSSFDAHQILDQVAQYKPAVIIIQKPTDLLTHYKGQVVQVPNTRKAMDELAHAYYGKPSLKLYCVGITGTNGKTTTSHLVEYLLNHFRIPTGVIGTIDHHLKINSQMHKWNTSLTTPGSLEYYSRLKDFFSLGAKALSVEVSSHAIDQDRMSSCEFDVAVFTNLTRDHLDYHGTMEAYFKAKEKLFVELLAKSNKPSKFAIINTDDEYGKKIKIPRGITKISYGSKNADLTYEVIDQDFSGQTINIIYQTRKYKCRLQIPGKFNILNFLATVGVAVAKNIPISDVVKAFEKFQGVRGRLEKVPTLSENSPHIFVDYAHTPDALQNALQTLIDIKKNKRIITVFGCGGDRDKGKRPLMSEIACRLSDMVIITSDNPRTENPNKIIEDIVKGCQEFKNFKTEVDRKDAIKLALQEAQPGDAILIAGKGHEDYQIIGKEKIHFDDVEVAKSLLK